jgi:osmoprotectant transport system permease protein
MRYLVSHPGAVALATLRHLELVAAALVVAACVAIPAGVAAARLPKLAPAVLGVASVVYTIPSLALFALLIPLSGLGFWTAVIALAAYAQMILIRNTAVALRGVPAPVVEAARAMGMTRGQVLVRVEGPLALPVFLAGLRVAIVSLIGIATVAAWINAGGLGTLVLGGIEQDYPDEAIAGAVAAVILAFAAEYALRRLERATARYRT